jgi:hypothetical protein
MGNFRTDSEAQQIAKIQTWFDTQPGCIALFRSKPSAGMNSGIDFSGISIILAISESSAKRILSGEISGYHLDAEDIVAIESATTAIILSVAIDPKFQTRPEFVGQAVFSHIREIGLLRSGIQLLAPAADRRRKEWLQATGFEYAGKNLAGREVFRLVLNHLHENG